MEATKHHETFGDWLRHERNRRMKSQEQLAQKAKITAKALLNIEKGYVQPNQIRMTTRTGLAEALRMSRNDLADIIERYTE